MIEILNVDISQTAPKRFTTFIWIVISLQFFYEVNFDRYFFYEP